MRLDSPACSSSKTERKRRAHDAGGLVPSRSGSRPLWRSRSGESPSHSASSRISRSRAWSAASAWCTRACSSGCSSAQPQVRAPFDRGGRASAAVRSPLIGEHASGSGVQPDARCIARRQLVETPPGREKHLRGGVLRVARRVRPPAAVRDDVGAVRREQRVETAPPVGVGCLHTPYMSGCCTCVRPIVIMTAAWYRPTTSAPSRARFLARTKGSFAAR